MKKPILFLFLLGCPWMLVAQHILDAGIFNSPANSDKLEIRIKPTQTVTNGAYTAGVFTVRFLSSYGVTLSAPANLNSSLFGYTLSNQGTDANYTYYSFSFVSPFTRSWTAGTAYPIAVLQINAGCGSGNGTFEILNNAWTSANNGDYYQELNGLDAQNIFYQATATAPLGSGAVDTTPPTITCPVNKTSGTDFNTCHHTNIGTGWDAIGNDNCPGFTITYILSGATVDTLFNTLDNAIFDKGITTANVTIKDVAGLTATCSFTVTVNDVQAPAITAPANITVQANTANCSASNVTLGTPLASDNCPGSQVSNNAPTIFPLGASTVIWTVTDAAGLTATASQTVTVQSNLSASALHLSAQQICNGASANLSFTLPGGVGPYTVVYSANGANTTINGYANNQLIPVSPIATTAYKLLSVSDAIGCAVTPTALSDTLLVRPNPSLSALLPSATEVCQGESVSFTATGLLPNENTTFQYTLQPGGPGTQTAVSSVSGSYTFPPATHSPGVYGMSIQSITVNGCTSNYASNNSASYTVSPFPTISGIAPSDTSVCSGTPIHLIASGMPPDVNATFNYTLNGTPGTQTVLTVSTGTANLLAATYPEGSYTVVISAITIGGCSVPVNLSTQFAVDPFQPMCGFTVAGRLATEKSNEGIEEAKVTISGLGNSVPFSLIDFTDTAGAYAYINTIPLASSYQIKPYKNDNPLNGVTTYDLVLISKHILGIERLSSLYKIIAADANKSNSITTFDIVEFRKLILGIYQDLPNNNSWRFIDRAYVFPDTNNPFVPVFPEVINRTNVQMSALNEDFIAVKVGDVNATAVVNAGPLAEDRDAWPVCQLNISASDQLRSKAKVEAGEVFTLCFRPEEPVAGYQFTLELQELEVLEIKGSEGMEAGNFAVFPDAVTSSFFAWNPTQTGTFSIRFRAKTSAYWHELISVSSRITAAEAYRPGADMLRMQVSPRFVGETVENQAFALYQNQPNPFSDQTVIPFFLPAADEVTLRVFDARGALVYFRQNRFEAGRNAFQIKANALPEAGVLYYQVTSTTDAAMRKMLKQ